MKKRKLLLAALAATMLIPSAMVPVSATDAPITQNPEEPIPPATEKKEVIPANLTKISGDKDKDGPAYGQAGTYTATVKAPDTDGVIEVDINATDLQQTVNANGKIGYWIGVGFLQKEGSTYTYGAGNIPANGAIPEAITEGEDGNSKDPINVTDGYANFYWRADLSDMTINTMNGQFSKYILVKETAQSEEVVESSEETDEPAITKYKINFTFSIAQPEHLTVNSVAGDTDILDKKASVLGNVKVDSVTTAFNPGDLTQTTGEIKLTGKAFEVKSASTEEVIPQSSTATLPNGYYVALNLTNNLKQSMFEVSGENWVENNELAAKGIYLLKVPAPATSPQATGETVSTAPQIKIFGKTPGTDGNKVEEANGGLVATYTVDLTEVTPVLDTEAKTVVEPATSTTSSALEEKLDGNTDLTTAVSNNKLSDDVSKNKFTDHAESVLKDVINKLQENSATSTVFVETGIETVDAKTNTTTVKKEDGTEESVVSYEVQLVPKVEISTSSSVSGTRTPLRLTEEQTKELVAKLGQLNEGEKIKLTFGLPDALKGADFLYVHHHGDGHSALGETFLVAPNPDGTVTIEVNHFSTFTFTEAAKAEIKAYQEGTQTSTAIPVGKTAFEVNPGEITLVVPEGIVVKNGNTPLTDNKFTAVAGQTYTIVAEKDPNDSNISSLDAPSTEYTFKVKKSNDNYPVGGTIKPAVKTQTMYRVYNKNNGEHFFTANKAEKDYLVSLGWKDEGTAWNAPATSDTPVFRVYNKNSGEHFYTTNAEEKAHLVSVGWQDEGIGWYSDEKKGVAVHRLFNPNAKDAGSHHYTVSESERDYLAGIGWRKENVGWYGVK